MLKYWWNIDLPRVYWMLSTACWARLLFCLCGWCRWFENVAKFCDDSSDRIPFGFILGFYVSLVVSRFWAQLNSLPWPSRMAVYVSSMIHGSDKRGRMIRRTIMRYFTISYILTMRNICPPVRKRFQKFKNITEKGIVIAHNWSTNFSNVNANRVFSWTLSQYHACSAHFSLQCMDFQTGGPRTPWPWIRPSSCCINNIFIYNDIVHKVHRTNRQIKE